MISRPIISNTKVSGTNNAPVNPTKDYTKQPAPMGICDFGVGPTSTQGYNYSTTMFLGDLNITTLNTASSNSYQLSIQLNVILVFNVSSVQYDFWIQDVGIYTSNTKQMSYENNIWNMTSSTTQKLTNTLKGNGTVASAGTNQDYYYTVAGSLPGNNVALTLPKDTQYLVVASVVSNYPHVAFEYNDGYNWQTFDNVTFTFAKNAQNVAFDVWGNSYNPLGLFNDAELILGGPGGGSSQTITAGTDSQFEIEYWNGHNFQEITNAYNFGSDTAETVTGVLENGFGYSSYGAVFANMSQGSSSLVPSYTRSQIGILNVSAPSIPTGNLYVNSVGHSYVGNDVNLTLAPGNYHLMLYSGGVLLWQYNITLTAGEYLFLVVGNTPPTYPVTFTESGLPSSTSWSVTFGGSKKSSTTTTISYNELNGTYPFTVTAVAGYTASPSSGNVFVNGTAMGQSITFTPIVVLKYPVTFTESGLPSSTSWSVTLGGSLKSSTNTTILYSESNASYPFTVAAVSGYTASPTSGNVVVNGGSAKQTITFTVIPPPKYIVTFTESGLPSGTSWSVTLGSSLKSSTTTIITFSESNASYPFTITNVSGYTVSPVSGNVIVNGGPKSQSIIFTIIPPTTYTVTLTESGLPSGTSWSVTLNGNLKSSGTSAITFSESNGTLPYTVGAISGYTANPSSGNVIVNGGPVSRTIVFVTGNAKVYTVTFKESGLPSSTSWTVTFNSISNSSTTDSISFVEPNGSYSFSIGSVIGWVSSPTYGNVTVSGSNPNVDITFVLVGTKNYNVKFIESGLATGTSWSVTMSGNLKSSTTDTIIFTMPNGTYPFIITSISGYSISPLTGNITLSGSDINWLITFTAKSGHSITFTESGLSSDSTWSVTLQGITKSSSSTTIIFTEPNGKYAYTVSAIAGYSAKPSAGNITVNGADINQSIAFTSTSGNSSSKTSGGLLGMPLFGSITLGIVLMIAIIVVIVAVIAVAVMKVRKKSSEPLQMQRMPPPFVPMSAPPSSPPPLPPPEHHVPPPTNPVPPPPPPPSPPPS